MAIKGFSSKTPQIDGGLGLVIRLNILFNRADRASLAGDFDEWNHVLDRVFVNLCYRQPLDCEINEQGKITKLRLDEDGNKIYEEFARQIRDIKRDILNALKAKNILSLQMDKQKYYDTLVLKDIWLRKYMNELGLYLKETSFDVTSAMFGG